MRKVTGRRVRWSDLRGYPRRVLHIVFTSLMVVVAVATVWFAGYVVYRLYSDQR
ncbi:hypothetical protein GCM10012275_49910 [Longimycelium tulufanense]|uniref:Uncharacterized protein n=1 Tax=Longimycelium tulufanense TaxID=907463 RepID=A0A8J3FY51_9PSEU|nr:hypothetical protein GCM10012275_49910 [Longimycelium tulufanense]